jgi:hypothetical protein
VCKEPSTLQQRLQAWWRVPLFANDMRRLTGNILRNELDLGMFHLLPVCLKWVAASFHRLGQTCKCEHDRLPLQVESMFVVPQLDGVLQLVQYPARLTYLLSIYVCADFRAVRDLDLGSRV